MPQFLTGILFGSSLFWFIGELCLLTFDSIHIYRILRCGRDFEKCKAKYGEFWDEYVQKVPYAFIPGIW